MKPYHLHFSLLYSLTFLLHPEDAKRFVHVLATDHQSNVNMARQRG